MPSIIQFGPMIAAQQLNRQQLERVPEPTQLTDTENKVAQYDEVMGTKLVMVYAAGLTVVHRARGDLSGGSAVDLACGPGHYTLCLAKYLGYKSVTGIDLSPRMVKTATENASKYQLDSCAQFRLGDATKLTGIEPAQFDLGSFTGAAHHLPDLTAVTAALRELDRVTKPSGLVMVMDLVRLRTAKLTERYVDVLGHDYVERGLPDFLDDFRNSMYAAWTAEEFRQAIPRDTERAWCHVVPRGLPSTQIILGLPVGRAKLFLRSGVPWSPDNCPVPKEMRSEWNLLRAMLSLASHTMVGRSAR